MQINKKKYSSGQRAQQGIVLLITLLLMVLMTFAALAVWRSDHTAQTTITTATLRSSGNAFTMPPIEAVIQKLAELYTTDSGRLTLAGSGTSMSGYSAVYQNDDNARGFPRKLLAPAPQNLWVFNDANNTSTTNQPTSNIAYVLVERLCKATGKPDRNTCVGNKPFHTGEQNKNNETSIELGDVFSAFKVSYRISVRVESPGQAVSFAQAIIQL